MTPVLLRGAQRRQGAAAASCHPLTKPNQGLQTFVLLLFRNTENRHEAFPTIPVTPEDYQEQQDSGAAVLKGHPTA